MSLKVHNISLRLQDTDIFSDLSFECPQGSFLSIIGPNGAGKSMLISSLLGIHQVTKGEIEILDSTPENLNRFALGYVPQRKKFDDSFPARVCDLIASAEKESWPMRISQLQNHKIQSLLEPLGLAHKQHAPLHQLSGGELQKVYLARAFYFPRKILILDEPATGVDSLGESDLYRILDSYRKEKKCSIIMVTHDVDVAKHHSSHVLLLNKKQLGFGSPSEVMQSESLDRLFGHSLHQHHD